MPCRSSALRQSWLLSIHGYRAQAPNAWRSPARHAAVVHAAVLQTYEQRAQLMQVLHTTMQEVLPGLPVIRRLIDSLALLDMLASFAQVPLWLAPDLMHAALPSMTLVIAACLHHWWAEQAPAHGAWPSGHCRRQTSFAGADAPCRQLPGACNA